MESIIFILACLLIAIAAFLHHRRILHPFVILPLLCPAILPLSSSLAYLIGGIVLLIQAADFLIEGAVWIANKAGVPPIITGILIIGLGTSMPELFVNILSALGGSTDLALGNILGSNITNMGLVIGTGGLIAGTISIQKGLISREIPIMLGATLMMILLAWNFFPAQESSRQALSFNDGLILLLGLFFYLLYMFQSMKRKDDTEAIQEQYEEHYSEEEIQKILPEGLHPLVLIVLGIGGLYLGGDYIIKGALDLASALGAGALALGIIVGVGTSLPELAAAISSARKGEPDLIIGNVVGSNIFNILLVLGVTATLSPIQTGTAMVPHLAITLGMSFLFFFFLGTNRSLHRWESAILSLGGLGYLIFSLIS